jgi:hypothetical protein
MTASREALIRDVMSLYPDLDRILAQVVVDLHFRCAGERGDEYDPEEIAENLISNYKEEIDEALAQHTPQHEQENQHV